MYVNVRERSGMVRLPSFCLLALLFTASLAVTAHPGYFPDAVEAYDRGDYKTAYGIWKEWADQGDAHAQNSLGTLYAEGQGVPQDLILAHKWFTLAVSRFPASEKKGRE
jgi:TPR repeat protein